MRLKLLAGQWFNGVSILMVLNICGPVVLGLSCQTLSLPPLLVCRELGISLQEARVRKLRWRFDDFVVTRDMGCDDLGYSLKEVLHTMRDLP